MTAFSEQLKKAVGEQRVRVKAHARKTKTGVTQVRESTQGRKKADAKPVVGRDGLPLTWGLMSDKPVTESIPGIREMTDQQILDAWMQDRYAHEQSKGAEARRLRQRQVVWYDEMAYRKIGPFAEAEPLAKSFERVTAPGGWNLYLSEIEPLQKARRVKAHTRKTPSGQMSLISEHIDRREPAKPTNRKPRKTKREKEVEEMERTRQAIIDYKRREAEYAAANKPKKPAAKPKDKAPAKPPSYQKRVQDNLQHMKAPTGWRSLAIVKMEEGKDAKKKTSAIPQFEPVPKGYTPAPSLYRPEGLGESVSIGFGAGATCELCGKQGLKYQYPIVNDEKKWFMLVGSECVTHFGEDSGKQQEKDFKKDARVAAILEVRELEKQAVHDFGVVGDDGKVRLSREINANPIGYDLWVKFGALGRAVKLLGIDTDQEKLADTDRQLQAYLRKNGDYIAALKATYAAAKAGEDVQMPLSPDEQKLADTAAARLNDARAIASGELAGSGDWIADRIKWQAGAFADLTPEEYGRRCATDRNKTFLQNAASLAASVKDWQKLNGLPVKKAVQPVKVRTRVLKRKTGPVVQPAHTETRAKAKPKPKSQPKTEPTAHEQVYEIPLAQIQADPHQHRKQFDKASLQELADSIKETGGNVTPIVLRRIDGEGPVKFQIIAGERRYRALKLNKMKAARAVVRENVSDEDALMEQVIENLNRQNVLPTEEATAYRQLADGEIARAKRRKKWRGTDFNDPDVQDRLENLGRSYAASKSGKQRSRVDYYIILTDLPEEVREMVDKGELTTAHAHALLRLTDPKEDNRNRDRKFHKSREQQLTRMARHARAHGITAKDLNGTVTEFIRAEQQTSMFGAEEITGGEKQERRREQKAKLSRIIDAIASAVSEAWDEKDQEFSMDALTGNDLQIVMQQVRGAQDSFGKIEEAIKRKMYAIEAQEATKRRVSQPEPTGGSGGGGEYKGESLFKALQTLGTRLRIRRAPVHAH